MDLKTLGNSLRYAREAKNMTQREVARKTGINNKTISNYENDVSLPDPLTLKAFADIYETSVDYLLGRPQNADSPSMGEDRKSLDVSGLPEEAILRAEEYVELLRLKYGIRPPARER
jgi:transcriptional regulator with XRE-family HTH domain